MKPTEPLWLFCEIRGIGGQATLRDVSAHGIGITVARRRGWRLVEALRDAHAAGAPVDVSRLPHDRYRQARVVWAAETATDEIRFGLTFTDPLSLENW